MTLPKKTLFAIIAPLIAAGVFLAFTGWAFCAFTLQVPRRLTSPPPNAITVTISAPDHVALSALWLQPLKTNGRCLIVLHGIGDSNSGSVSFAPLFLNEGYSVLAPDSRAHGRSGGTFVTYGLLEKYDVLAWLSWMKNAGCSRLYGLGESLGASVLIQTASIQFPSPFSAIVAECAYADLKEIAEFRTIQLLHLPAILGVSGAKIVGKLIVVIGMYYARIVDGFDFHKVSPVRDIAHTSTPILLIHGLADFRTPPYNSEQLFAANLNNQLWLVPNALHTGAAAAAPKEFHDRVLTWFAKY